MDGVDAATGSLSPRQTPRTPTTKFVIQISVLPDRSRLVVGLPFAARGSRPNPAPLNHTFAPKLVGFA